MKKIRIYQIVGRYGAECAILEQLLNGKQTFFTLQEQGDGSFWFTEDSSIHPTINLDEWFSTLLEAEKYLENYHGLKLELLEETETTDLNWA